MVTEVIAGATAIINKMPDGPEKNQYLSFLKVIGEALNSLQDSIYAMQAGQSQSSKALSRGKLQGQLDDIATQQASADKTKKKEAKMASMGPVGEVFAWIFKIIMLVVSIFLGPLAFVLALAYFVDCAVSAGQGNKETYLQKLFTMIGDKLPPAAAAVVKYLLAAVLSILSCNPLLAMNLMTQDSGIIQSVVEACGGDAMAQAIAGAVLNMVVQVVFMVFVMILTGGASTAAVAGEVAKMIAEATEISLKTAQMAVRVSMIVVQVVLSSIQISAEVIQINNNSLLSQIDMIKGRAEKYSEQVQAIIALLKKVIDKLLEMLQGGADQIVSINTFQGQKWDQASQISSDLAG